MSIETSSKTSEKQHTVSNKLPIKLSHEFNKMAYV